MIFLEALIQHLFFLKPARPLSTPFPGSQAGSIRSVPPAARVTTNDFARERINKSTKP
jgi:hypothetical protein